MLPTAVTDPTAPAADTPVRATEVPSPTATDPTAPAADIPARDAKASPATETDPTSAVP